ncbi:hypothetical protein [Mycolicibacterium iranicum]|uniref:Uncharacterized protein n=1 Tax=Mycolicibacterium iranicum TaxID=912594 RepID=A0A178LZF9_MYCIR|nr:hypothetical protein [Mycolicibacterium iranicum]OAN40335.1 hypothetical protein A4X20_14540 [Mycolicibacterium iranicum]
MRPGDEMLVPDEDGPWPQAAMHGRILDIRDDEASGYIVINGELIRGASGLFEKPALPGEVLQRLLQPGGPVPGTESILVRANDLWKWVGVQMNDPNGSPEQYLIRTFRRVHDDEINGEAVELKLQSVWNRQKVNTITLMASATVSFHGHR